MTPKCTSWLGHKFEGRFTEQPTRLPNTEQLFWLGFSGRDAVIKTSVKRTYERDVCIRCGATVEKQAETKL